MKDDKEQQKEINKQTINQSQENLKQIYSPKLSIYFNSQILFEQDTQQELLFKAALKQANSGISQPERITYYFMKYFFPNLYGFTFGGMAYLILKRHYKNLFNLVKSKAASELNKGGKLTNKPIKGQHKYDYLSDLQKLEQQSNKGSSSNAEIKSVSEQDQTSRLKLIFVIFYLAGFINGLCNYKENFKIMASRYYANNILPYQYQEKLNQNTTTQKE